MHSTSSCSSASRPRTKAALKGFEHIKVSIPTTGIDLQQALDRSPNANGCKLAALADIALGTEPPTIFTSNAKNNTLSPRTSYSSKSTLSPKGILPRSAVSPRVSSLQTDVPAQTTKEVVKHGPLVLHKSNVDTAVISKNIIDSIVNTQKKKKRTPQSTGNRLGFKEKKKKTKANAKTRPKGAANAPPNDKPRDIYDFEESHDSVEDEIIPMTHSRTQKTESSTSKAGLESTSVSKNVGEKTAEPIDSVANGSTKKREDTADEESSYSDRDDYYNFNSISGSGSEEDERSEADSVMTKKRSKTPANVQKKCLIMGRIFKNAKKDPEPQPEPKEIAKPLPKQQLDEIFDNLRSKTDKQEADIAKPKDEAVNSEASDSKDNQEIEESSLDDGLKRPGKARKPREIANLEAEWGMSMEKIKELIGIGKRKTQRRCASNQQRKLVETWSSDEYEEFHSTKDVIALIQEAEMKAQRAKARSAKQLASAQEKLERGKVTAEKVASESNSGETVKTVVADKEEPDAAKNHIDSIGDNVKEAGNKKPKNKPIERKDPVDNETVLKVDKPKESIKSKPKKTAKFSGVVSEDSDFDEHWNKTAKRAKIRNRRRTIHSREDMYREEPITPKLQTKAKEFHESPSRKLTDVVGKRESKLNEISSTGGNKPKDNKPGNITSNAAATPKEKSTARRKRSATEKLYYWPSSSSDEEDERTPTQENEEDGNSESHLEQHGWIVGDSHKKLVTLLAHAKGKNIDDCGVKETAHKKK